MTQIDANEAGVTSIDLRRLDAVPITVRCDVAHITWSDTLVVARWKHDGDDDTLMIDKKGRVIHVRERYSDLISEISREYHIERNTMQALYQQADARTVGGVSGHHRLVPLSGLTNSGLTFIVADNLRYNGVDSSPRHGGTVLTFNGYDHDQIRVLVSASTDTVKRNLALATRVGHWLIDKLNMINANYCCDRDSDSYLDYGELDRQHQTERAVCRIVLARAVQQAFRKTFQRDAPEEFQRNLIKILTEPYDGAIH